MNSSWGSFSWSTDNEETSHVPGRCVFFLNLSNMKYKGKITDIFDMGMHVVIKSFKSVPRGNIHGKKNIAEVCLLSSDSDYYCVPVDTIYDTAFVIPNFEENETSEESMIFVYPRDEWKDNF